MENKALLRLEAAVERLLERHGKVVTREKQLAGALSRAGEEAERLKGDNFRMASERTSVRKRIDKLVTALDGMLEGEDSEATE